MLTLYTKYTGSDKDRLTVYFISVVTVAW